MFRGEAVRDFRHKLGWSRQQLASYLGVSEKEVTSWETGQSQPPNEALGALYRLADSTLIPFDPFRTDSSSLRHPRDPFTDPRLTRVRHLVETRYTDPIHLQQAAGAACLEAKYFSKFFHKKVGRPFSVWLASFRIEKATEMLVESELQVSAIAYAVGFQSLRTFERAFKRITGCAPVEYRTKRRPLSVIKTSGDET